MAADNTKTKQTTTTTTKTSLLKRATIEQVEAALIKTTLRATTASQNKNKKNKTCNVCTPDRSSMEADTRTNRRAQEYIKPPCLITTQHASGVGLPSNQVTITTKPF